MKGSTNMKYYVIRNKALASAIAFITKEPYYTYEDREDNTKKVYSFKRTKKFDLAIDEIDKLVKKINKIDN